MVADEQYQDTLEFFYSKDGEDCQIFKAYLQQEKSDKDLQNKVEKIFENSNVIFLQYERDTLIDTDSLLTITITRHDSIRPIGSIYINGYALESSRDFCFRHFINIAFDKGFLKTGHQPDFEEWLRIMKLPLEIKYRPTFVRIIYSPSDSILRIMRESYKLIISQVVNVIDSLMPQYKQLQDFNNTNYSIDIWEKTTWPCFPNIFYRTGLREIPNSKGLYEKITNNWCEITMVFEIVNGSPYAGGPADRHSKIYPRQGICVRWCVISANDDLNNIILQTIDNGINSLDIFEKELELKIK